MKQPCAPGALARRMIDCLDCPCEWFPPMADDDPILARFSAACKEGEQEGFIPVLIAVDELLAECLSPEDCLEEGNPVREKQRTFHAQNLRLPLPDGAAYLDALLKERLEELEEGDITQADFLGEIEGGEPLDRFSAFWDYTTGKTHELLLAHIPVSNPWEVFAFLPMGGWNECPDTPELMAAARRWYEAYGAIPAAINHDELEFRLPAPVPSRQALRLAWEHYAFCPDRIDQCEESGTVGPLADTLSQSTVWYFWWD